MREIAREKGLSFKMAVIQSEFEKDLIIYLMTSLYNSILPW